MSTYVGLHKDNPAIALSSHEWYRLLFEQANDGMFLSTLEGRYVDVNPSACEMLGYSREELLNLTMFDLVPALEQQVDPIRIDGIVAGQVIRRERTIIGKDGRHIPVEISGRRISNGLLLGTVRVIDLRKQAEWLLKESEERYRTLVENSHDLIQRVAPDGHLLFANKAWLRTLRYSEDELADLSLWQIIASEEHEHCKELFARVMSGEHVANIQTIFLSKDGQRIHVEGNASPHRVNGTIVSTHSLFRNITERLRQEQDLHTQAYVLENISEGVNYVDDQGIIRFANNACSQMFGYEPGELIGQPVSVLNNIEAEENAKLVGSILEVLRRDGMWVGEFRNRKKDGTPFVSRAKIQALPLQGKPFSVTVQEDITAQREAEMRHAKLEEQLRHVQKMEGIGLLAGGIAHDFNNLLTILRGHIDLMRDSIASGNPIAEDIEQIDQATQQATDLVRQLLAFSRKQILEPRIIDLNGLINNLYKMLRRLIGEDVILAMTMQSSIWPITADPGQIEQVLMNLVVNARDAMPLGGELSINTKNVQISETLTSPHVELAAGNYVMLAVSDSGHGMDTQTQERIFEPFFTTKEFGRGTGMGLAMVYGIIKQSGGQVVVHSRPGHGSTFSIYLPANPSAIYDEAVQSHLPVVHSPTHETILLVEDEILVRQVAAIALKGCGYTVLEAEDSFAALTLFECYGDEIDLLVTDLVMPRMSGRELAERLWAQRSDLRVLFTSGYTDDHVVRHGLLAAEVAFLSKPFSPFLLAKKVRDMLDAD